MDNLELELCKKIIMKINKETTKSINIMEVCGSHTRSIYKYGINKILPNNINLLSGPGCPVCVTTESFIDNAISLSKREDVVIVTFGDMIKVPGSSSSLSIEKSKGSYIKVINSPLQVLDILKKYKNKKVVLLAVGFETTMPTIAKLLRIIEERNIKNFYVLQEGKRIPKIMEHLLKDDDVKIDGFLVPGHVATITGISDFKNIAEEYNVPMVVSGFECLDILGSILALIRMINNNESTLKNLYKRAVNNEGNLKALIYIDTVFNKSSGTWRGIGEVDDTGYELLGKYKYLDAKYYFELNSNSLKNNYCMCGEILKGKKKPYECALFGKSCTPNNPKGPCMVSAEGGCSIAYSFK